MIETFKLISGRRFPPHVNCLWMVVTPTAAGIVFCAYRYWLWCWIGRYVLSLVCACQILKPMMLRRLKEDVEKNLAPKEETIIEVCNMCPLLLFNFCMIYTERNKHQYSKKIC